MISGILTGVLLLTFIGLWVWAWSRRRKTDFDEAAHLPLEDSSAPAKERVV
jgi:cytochrome c oxidase cbb3-type subunit IV